MNVKALFADSLRRYFPRVVAIALVTLSALMLFPGIPSVQFAAGADEGYYLSYATNIRHNGVSAFPRLFSEYIGDSRHWVFPNPLRVGHLSIAALWQSIAGKDSFASLARLSAVCWLLTVVFGYVMIALVVNERRAALLTLLTAFSPLGMGLARRALGDTMTGLAMLLCIALFFLALRRPAPGYRLLFMLAFFSAILIKETSVLLAVPFALFGAYAVFSFGKEKTSGLTMALMIALPLVCSGCVMIAAAGGVQPLITVGKIIVSSPGANPYAVAYCTGPWYRYVIDGLLLSPFTTMAAIGSVFYLIVKKRADLFVTYMAVVAICGFIEFNFFAKNIRYLLYLDVPGRVLALFMLERIVSAWVPSRFADSVLWGAVFLIAMADLSAFNHLFLTGRIYDPVSANLLQLLKIIP